MTNLQQLLEEKYPNSEISEIQRKAFEEGWNHALTVLHEKAENNWLLKTMSFCNELKTNNNGQH